MEDSPVESNVVAPPTEEHAEPEPPDIETDLDGAEAAPVAVESSAPTPAGKGGGYNFAADLKLDEEEEIEDFSSDLDLPEPAPAPAPAPSPIPAPQPPPAPVAEIRPAPQRQEMETEFRPSFLDLLEPPATGNESSNKASTGEKKAVFYDPPPLPQKRIFPALPHMPLSVKKMAILGTVAVVALAVWLVPQFSSSGPNPGRILEMLEDSDPQTRIEGIYSLQSLELEPGDASDRLLKILREDQVDEVRVAAVNTLVNFGVTPQQASGELKPLLATEQHDTVKQLLQWLIQQSSGKP